MLALLEEAIARAHELAEHPVRRGREAEFARQCPWGESRSRPGCCQFRSFRP